MRDTVIKVDGLSKAYQIGARERHGRTFREAFIETLAGPFRRMRSIAGGGNGDGGSEETFWALKDVSFEVRRGEVLGIIGRNGAGKSTLLKVLSRITEPTSGNVRLRGRVASLLEVGTGFHPELTGRENIYLNGAVLGMKRAEITRQFDEIVAFAEVEKFLDTPVKRYSSGMYVRLAFAVAAHLEPEILIVDEVLAVGDAEFQKKCLGKMQDVATGEGRTVLFVSHNMAAVQKLCTRGVLLRSGRMERSGDPAKIIAEHVAAKVMGDFSREADGKGPQITGVRLLTRFPQTSEAIELEVEWFLPESWAGIKVGVGFNTVEDLRVFDCGPEDMGLKTPAEAGRHRAIFRVPAHSVMARTYLVSAGLWREGVSLDHVLPALQLTVEAGPGGPYSHESSRGGLVHVACAWDELR